MSSMLEPPALGGRGTFMMMMVILLIILIMLTFIMIKAVTRDRVTGAGWQG